MRLSNTYTSAECSLMRATQVGTTRRRSYAPHLSEGSVGRLADW